MTTTPPHDAPDSGDGRAADPGAVWDERYAATVWPAAPDETLAELVTPLRAGRALDLGCGPGRNAVFLARLGWQVTGVDASGVGLAQAAARAEEAGVPLQLVQADLLSYEPAPASFDLVVVANLHFAPEDRAGFFARAVAAVAPGGHCYVVGHHLDSLGRAGPPHAERLLTEELLVALLDPLPVQARRQLREVPGATEPLVDAIAWASAPDGRR